MTTKQAKQSREYCPCCHRPMPKPRVEQLRPELARVLQQIYAESSLGYAKIPAYKYKAQHSRLKHWGFLEEGVFVRPNGSPQRRPGVWRVTEAGEEWLAGYSRVPFELLIEKDQAVGPVGDRRVTLSDVLGLEDQPREDDGYTSWSDFDHSSALVEE